MAALLTPRRLAGLGVVLALLVVVVLVLARGGGGSRTARPASPPVGTTAASPAAYPATAQRAFLDACVGSTPERRAFCTCSLDQFQHSMPWAEFRQVGQQASTGDTALRRGGGRLHRPAPAGGSVSRGGSGGITPTGEGHRGRRGWAPAGQRPPRRGRSTTRAGD